MAQYAQNSTFGNTCPWGSDGSDARPDAFSLAAAKAERRRESKETISSVTEAPQAPQALKSSRSAEALSPLSTSRSTRSTRSTATRASQGSQKSGLKSQDVEAKMMDLIQKCLDKKVVELHELKSPAPPAQEAKSSRSVRSAYSAGSACSAGSGESVLSKSPVAPSAETAASLGSLGSPAGPEAVTAVTMAGRRAQAQKLSGASLGQFDGDQSRAAFLEMQRSAAEARSRNRSALCFEEPALAKAKEAKLEAEPEAKQAKQEAKKGETLVGKRAQAQKLSDASLGKFDADQSRVAYLEMQRSAAEVRNKNRSAECFKPASPKGSSSDVQYPALLEGLASKASKASKATAVTMAGKRAQRDKVSEAALGKFDADKSRSAYLDMHKSAEELRNKNRVGQGVF